MLLCVTCLFRVVVECLTVHQHRIHANSHGWYMYVCNEAEIYSIFFQNNVVFGYLKNIFFSTIHWSSRSKMRGKLFLVFYFFVKHKLIVTFYHIYKTKILHEEWFRRSRAMVKLGHCVSSPSNPSYCIINKHICFSDATFSFSNRLLFITGTFV